MAASLSRPCVPFVPSRGVTPSQPLIPAPSLRYIFPQRRSFTVTLLRIEGCARYFSSHAPDEEHDVPARKFFDSAISFNSSHPRFPLFLSPVLALSPLLPLPTPPHTPQHPGMSITTPADTCSLGSERPPPTTTTLFIDPYFSLPGLRPSTPADTPLRHSPALLLTLSPPLQLPDSHALCRYVTVC